MLIAIASSFAAVTPKIHASGSPILPSHLRFPGALEAPPIGNADVPGPRLGLWRCAPEEAG